jgi:hypothetical protein
VLLLLPFSGLAAALTAAFFIVLPTFFVGIKYKTEPISYVARRNIAGRFFKFGLVITSFLLICNTVTLVLRFKIEHSIGPLIYILGAFCMSLVAFIDIDSNERVHTYFTKGYFLFSVLGSVFCSYAVWPGFSVHMLLALIGGIGTTVLYFKGGLKAYSEYWGILFAILWVVYFYFV